MLQSTCQLLPAQLFRLSVYGSGTTCQTMWRLRVAVYISPAAHKSKLTSSWNHCLAFSWTLTSHYWS